MQLWIAPQNGLDFRLDLQEGSVLYTAMPFRQARQLPISPVSYGHFIAGPGHFTQRSQCQPLYQLFYTHSGSGRFIVDGRESIAGPGSIALLDMSLPNRYEALSEGWNHEWVNFTEASCGVYHDLINPDGFTVHYPGELHSLLSLMHEIRDTLALKDPLETVHAGALIVCLLDACHRALLRQRRASDPGDNIARAIRHIEKHFDQPITLDQLAQTAFLSRYYFVRAFRKATGMTPIDYLNTVRVHHAQNLLLTTRLSVEEIAHQTGYSGSKQLIRRFTHAAGMTPGEYRKATDPGL